MVWLRLSIALVAILCLSGCAKGQADNGGATASAGPASPAEAAKVIDLRMFPLLAGANVHDNRSIARLEYEVTTDVPAAFNFQRRKLTEAGWKELADSSVSHQYASGTFARDGFKLSVLVMPASNPDESGMVSITILNNGNVDTAKLPVPAGAKLLVAAPVSTSYLTDAAEEATSEAVAKLLLAQGWEPYGTAGNAQFFKRAAVRLTARVASAPAQAGKTVIDYSTEQLSVDLPVPREARQVQYSDTPAQVSFSLHGSIAEADAFYRRVLGERHWEATTERPVQRDFRHFEIFRNPAKELIEVEVTPLDEMCAVLVKFQTADEVAELDRLVKEQAARERKKALEPKPQVLVLLPEGATKVEAASARIEFEVPSGQAKAARDFLREQLAKLGWSEETKPSIDTGLGEISETKFNQASHSITIEARDLAGLPCEVTIDARGVELQVRAK